MGEDKLWDEYADYVVKRTIYEGLKTTFRQAPPETLTYLIMIVKEKVWPLLRKKGVPIMEEELINLFEEWFIRVGRFKVGLPDRIVNKISNNKLKETEIVQHYKMTRKARPNWDKINSPNSMSEPIGKYLQIEIAKQRSLKSKPDISTERIKTLLEGDDMDTQGPRFQYLNMHEDHVNIIDNDVGRVAGIYFKSRGIFCDICEATKCIHVDFALTVPGILRIFEEKGLPIPRLRSF